LFKSLKILIFAIINVMNKIVIKVSLLVFIFVLYSCSSIRLIKPIKKGEKLITADIGGPLVIFSGAPIFLPLTSIGGAYGFTDNFSLQTSLHTTSLLFGTFHMESFANTNIKNFDRSGFSLNYGVYYFWGLRENIFSLYPAFDINYYRHYSNKNNYFYTSFSSLIELRNTKAFNEPIKQQIIPTLSFGHRWLKEKYEFGVELKYLNFIKDNTNIVVEYIAPFNKGSLGLYFSLSKKF